MCCSKIRIHTHIRLQFPEDSHVGLCLHDGESNIILDLPTRADQTFIE